MAQPLTVADLETRLLESKKLIADKWGWFLALGIVLIVAGLAAIAFPLMGTIAAKILLGWLFLIGGVMMIVHAFQAPGWQGFLWELLIGILYAFAGAYLAFFPFTGLITLALVALGPVHRRGHLRGDPGIPRSPARGLVLAAAERHRRPGRRRPHRPRTAGFGGLGTRPSRRHQPSILRLELCFPGAGWAARARGGRGDTLTRCAEGA